MAVPVVPGFAREKKTRPVTARAAPPCSGLRHSCNLRVDLALARREPRWRPSDPTPPPPAPFSSRPRRSTRSSERPGSRSTPPYARASRARAPGSPRSRSPDFSASTLGCESRRPAPPPPGRALVLAGSPASCTATAARDPPPARLPLSCLFRSTNNFCSDAGSLGPGRPLFPAPPSGYENSKQLADLRVD